MAWFTGVVLAFMVAAFARMVGLDKDRAFYPTVLVVVASYYDLFAVMGGSPSALGAEMAVTAVFLVAVALGFRWNLWIIVGALAAHGLFDLVHPHLIVNPGVPAWWPGFCMTYDVTAAACLAVQLSQRGPPGARGSGSLPALPFLDIHRLVRGLQKLRHGR